MYAVETEIGSPTRMIMEKISIPNQGEAKALFFLFSFKIFSVTAMFITIIILILLEFAVNLRYSYIPKLHFGTASHSHLGI